MSEVTISPEIVNYGISIMLLIGLYVILQGKAAADPNFKVLGLSFERIKTFVYVGIGINVIMILGALLM